MARIVCRQPAGITATVQPAQCTTTCAMHNMVSSGPRPTTSCADRDAAITDTETFQPWRTGLPSQAYTDPGRIYAAQRCDTR